MKLFKFPDDLPIDAVGHVTKVLAILIEAIKSKSIFLESHGVDDYQETINDLHRDLINCFNLYEDWQQEPEATQFKPALTEMHLYLEEANGLLKNASQSIH